MKTPIKMYKKIKKCYEAFEEATKALFADNEFTWDPVLAYDTVGDELFKAFVEANSNLEEAVGDFIEAEWKVDDRGTLACIPVLVDTYPTPLGYYAYVVTNHYSGEIIRYRHIDEVADYLLYDCFVEDKSLKKFCKELTEQVVE